MKGLTGEAVELQQCARDRRPNTALRIPGSPHSSRSPFGSVAFGENRRNNMANTTDAAFVDDIDVDQEIRSRSFGSKNTNPLYMPNTSGATSSGLDSDREDAPLLSPSPQDYGSSNGHGNTNGGRGWDGDTDFRGLPWWKRPSVRAHGLV
jgi:hypothetical protein